jgi:hypothetical protein
MNIVREHLVDALIAYDMESILDEGHDNFLYDILLYGFKGYENYTTEELQAECVKRGL